MKKVVLCPNPHRDEELKITNKAKEILEQAGFSCVICPVYWNGDPKLGPENNDIAIANEAKGACLVVSFGGDGTILHTAKMTLGINVPIIGVNLGNLGFLAELKRDELQRLILAAQGKYTPSLRMLLDVTLERAGKIIYKGTALNDAVVKGLTQAINISVASDGRKILNYTGDGIILSTPNGSTAYSLSAGGPIVEPTAENIIVTPVCAHVLAARSFVLAPDRTLEITLTGSTGKQKYLSVDGDEPIELQTGDIIRARKAANQVLIAHVGNKGFFDVVYEKLGDTK